MKKSAIALAVASVFATPMAFAATGNVEVYGVIDIAVEDTDATGATPNVISNYSRIGFKGSEDLGGGLKALWQIETDLDSGYGSDIGDTNWATRNSFIGLAGDFGTVVMGRHDTPYKMSTSSLDIFGDTIADYNLGRLGVGLVDNRHDIRPANAVAYLSPSFNGFSFAGAVVMDDASGDDDKTADALSLSATYTNGPLMLTAAYQDLTDVAGYDDKDKATKLGASYTIGNLKLGAVYETVDYVANYEIESFLINGAYSMGPVVLKAQIGQIEHGWDGVWEGESYKGNFDGDLWAVGIDYNLSKRTKLYAVYGKAKTSGYTSGAYESESFYEDLGGSTAGWNVGVRHTF